MKNIIKILAVLVLVFTLSAITFALPSAVVTTDSAEESAFAEDLFADISADGTQQSPYEIRTSADFNNYANLIKSNNSVYGNKYYKLCGNIDFKGSDLVPFGTEVYPFKGTLDGNGYAILNVEFPDKYDSGIVGYMTMGTIKNLRVEYSDILVPDKFYSTEQKYYFGGILGRGKVDSGKKIEITGCQTSGDISIKSSKVIYAGGVIASLDACSGNAVISDCFTDMSYNISAGGNSYLGGFAAYTKSGSTGRDCTMKNCLSFGDVSLVTTASEATVASFAGYVQKDEDGNSGWASDGEAVLASETVKHFENCVALGSVSAKSTKIANVGIFYANKAGEGLVVLSNCYSSNEQTVKAEAAKPKLMSVTGTKLAADNFTNYEFYENNLGIDFENKWYFTGTKLSLRTVAKSQGAGETSDEKDVRLSSDPGLRFRAIIETEKRDYCMEYGFIIARKDELAGQELTFDFAGRKIWGVGFDSTTDKFIDKDDTTVTISGVITGIPEEHYGTELVARTYIKFTNSGETVIVYSAPQTSSINLSAQAVRDSESYEYLTDSQKALLETMLPKA